MNMLIGSSIISKVIIGTFVTGSFCFSLAVPVAVHAAGPSDRGSQTVQVHGMQMMNDMDTHAVPHDMRSMDETTHAHLMPSNAGTRPDAGKSLRVLPHASVPAFALVSRKIFIRPTTPSFDDANHRRSRLLVGTTLKKE